MGCIRTLPQAGGSPWRRSTALVPWVTSGAVIDSGVSDDCRSLLLALSAIGPVWGLINLIFRVTE